MTSNRDKPLKDQLRQQRNCEIDFLQDLRIKLLQAKNELNNDLTRLAIRNLPIMDAQIISGQTDQTNNVPTPALSQVVQSSSTDFMEQIEIQQLEPLDLNL